MTNTQKTTEEHIIDLDAEPRIPDSWEGVQSKLLIESSMFKKGGQFRWNPSRIHLFKHWDQENSVAKGAKLYHKLADMPLINSNLLDYLLNNQHLIPDEWKGKRIFFWGTIYRSHGGIRYVSCLYQGKTRWFRWTASLDFDVFLGDNDYSAILVY